MNIEIKKMNKNHLEEIKENLETEFDDFWNYNILKEELSSDSSKYIVAISKNEVIGFAGIKFALDQVDIMNIVTRKNYRNKGVGTLLLRELISICKEFKANSIFLEVSEDNEPAIKLYKKLGFENVGIRKNYYKDKNGIVMRYIAEDKWIPKNVEK